MSVFSSNGGSGGGFSGGCAELVLGSQGSDASFPIRAFSVDVNNATLTSNGLVDGVLRLTGLVIPEDFEASGFVWLQDQKGVYTADNENGFAVYTSDGTSLTKVQSGTNSGNVWKADVGQASCGAVDARSYSAGDLVWIATLFNTSALTTAANLVCGPAPYSATAQLFGLGASEAWNAYLAAQTTLPESIAWSAVTSSGLRMRLGVGLY